MVKVLMLGWEFPPVFSGGLGVATYGIVKALSRYAKVRLILPNASEQAIENVSVLGLNKAEIDDIQWVKLKYNLVQFAEIQKIDMTLSPYHFVNQTILASQEHLKASDSLNEVKNKITDLFSGSSNYGYDIMLRVSLYALLVEQAAADGDYDVIHAHDWVTFPGALRLKKRTGRPLVLHVHALETDRAGTAVRNEIYHIEQNAMQTADRIVAVSAYTKSQIVEHYHIDGNKIMVVHNGIDPALTVKSTHQLRDKIVVFLGRITNQKGPHFLIEAAEKVLRVYPRVKFIVAGTGDQFGPSLETVAYKKLGSKFIFTGFLSKQKVDSLLSMADVYFMPSVSEPFGLTALEAAQHKVPSVISVQSGAAEVMSATLKADFWDTDKLANYIYALLQYNALGKTLTETAVEELEDLTWGHNAEKLLAIYNQLI